MELDHVAEAACWRRIPWEVDGDTENTAVLGEDSLLGIHEVVIASDEVVEAVRLGNSPTSSHQEGGNARQVVMEMAHVAYRFHYSKPCGGL